MGVCACKGFRIGIGFLNNAFTNKSEKRNKKHETKIKTSSKKSQRILLTAAVVLLWVFVAFTLIPVNFVLLVLSFLNIYYQLMCN